MIKYPLKIIFLGIVIGIGIQACKDSSSGPDPSAELQITSVEPESGAHGTEVIITGKGFKATASSNEIKFNGIDAVVDSASSTVLKTTVPERATAGKVTVSVGDQTAEGPEFEVLTTGAVEVIVTTSGPDQDRDGYMVNIDKEIVLESTVNDTLIFPNLEQGSHQLEVEELDNECNVKGENPQTVSVIPEDTTYTFTEVQCEEVVLQKQIIYAWHKESSSDYGLYVMDEDGSNPIPLVTGYLDSQPVISPDGMKVAFISSNRDAVGSKFNNDIYIIDASGSPINRVTNTSSSIVHHDPSWSTNGQKLIFSQKNNHNYQIATVNIDGSGISYLTDNSFDDYDPSFSGDGSKIVFSSNRQAFVNDIYIMNADGTNIINLTNNDSYNDIQPSWSPDGSQIVFVRINSNEDAEIWVIHSDGSNIQRVTFNNSDDLFPRWSPDGRHIIFQRLENKNWDIYKISIEGMELKNLTASPNIHETQPYWNLF